MTSSPEGIFQQEPDDATATLDLKIKIAAALFAGVLMLTVFSAYRSALVEHCHVRGGVWDGAQSRCRLVPWRMYSQPNVASRHHASQLSNNQLRTPHRTQELRGQVAMVAPPVDWGLQ